MHSLDKNLIIRYVGNRFPVIFQMCANIIYLREPILEYLRSTCGKAYAKCIINALQSDIIRNELNVGGLFGNFWLSPGWRLSIKIHISNLEIGKYMQKVVTNLEPVVEDPVMPWSAEFYCFDRAVEPIKTEPIRLALTTVEPVEKMKGLARWTDEALIVVIRCRPRITLMHRRGASMGEHLKVYTWHYCADR